MRILVTGGTGFVSKRIAEYFLWNDVYVLNRNTRPQLPKVKLIECDRRNINGKLKGLHFDWVIDVTAYTAEDVNSLLDNLESFDNYIMISSGAVYPDTLKPPYKESDECGRNKFWGDYGVNKAEAEKALRKRVPDAYIIRPPYLFGEDNNLYREAFVFDCAERDMPFYLPKDGSMPLQFFHVDDLCRFIEMLMDEGAPKITYNVGNDPITVKEWVEMCYKAVGKTPTFVNVYGDIDQRNYFPFYDYEYVLNTSLQNWYGWDLMPLDVGLENTYSWYRKHKDAVKRKNYIEFIERYLKK